MPEQSWIELLIQLSSYTTKILGKRLSRCTKDVKHLRRQAANTDTENDVELHDNPVLQVPYFKSRVPVKRGRDWNREDQDGNSEDNSDGDGMEQCYRIQNPTVLGTDRKPANKKTSI